jgi:hypothetical protein
MIQIIRFNFYFCVIFRIRNNWFMRFYILFFLIILLSPSDFIAQEKGLVRLGTNLGLTQMKNGIGFGADMDLRYTISNNFNIGYKFMGSDLVKAQNFNGKGSGVSSSITACLVTGDYYFHYGNSNFSPFIGAGFGTYYLSNVAFMNEAEVNDAASLKAVPDMTPGTMLRMGFEWWKLRFSYECIFAPDSYVINTQKKNVGIISNECSTISIGIFVGGGNWRQKKK